MFPSGLSAAKKRLIAVALAILAVVCLLWVTANRWWPLSPAEQLFVGKWKSDKPQASTNTFRSNRVYVSSDGLTGRWWVSTDGLLCVQYWGSGGPGLIPLRIRGSDKFGFKFRFDDSSNGVELDCVEDQTHTVLNRLRPE
jgi:hypothetical protein